MSYSARHARKYQSTIKYQPYKALDRYATTADEFDLGGKKGASFQMSFLLQMAGRLSRAIVITYRDARNPTMAQFYLDICFRLAFLAALNSLVSGEYNII